jgi:hypothetical protein
VRLLRSLDLEDKWERARQEEHRDGEWGRRHGRRALSSGVCLCKEKKGEGGGMDGGGPGDDDRDDDRRDDRASSSPLLGGGGRTLCPPSQDLMLSSIERNFLTLSSSGDAIVFGRLLWWGVESNYAGAPYDVVVGANVVTSPYEPVALARTFDA